MSEEKSVISSINVTSTDIKCPGCGTSIGVSFDPATGTITCPFCGLSTQLPTPQEGAVAEELDFNAAIQRASVDWGKYKKLIICANCGGQSVYDTEQVTGACPFCGSTSVAPAAENNQIMVPNAVIPFSITKEQTQDLFINFAKRKKLVNKKVFDCKLEKVVGIYLPYWTFDALTASTYYGEHIEDSRGKPVTGKWYQNFDDILIFATNRLQHPYISKVLDYDYSKAVPYSPEYLAGIPTERYTIGLDEGWDRSKKLIAKKLKKDIQKYFSRLLVDKIYSNYYNVRFRCLLAPMYLATFTIGDKTYPVAINGQTGKTYCDVPTYIKRLIILGILAILVGAAIEVLIIILYGLMMR